MHLKFEAFWCLLLNPAVFFALFVEGLVRSKEDGYVNLSGVFLAVLMSKILKRSGGNDMLFSREPLYKKLQEESLFLSLGHQADIYFPTYKKTRVSVPFIFCGDNIQQKKPVSIDALPDECIFEIFKRLPGDREKCMCMCFKALAYASEYDPQG